MDLEEGALNFDINGYYSIQKDVEPILGDAELVCDCSGDISTDCFASPKWRHTGNVNYLCDDWRVGVKWRNAMSRFIIEFEERLSKHI